MLPAFGQAWGGLGHRKCAPRLTLPWQTFTASGGSKRAGRVCLVHLSLAQRALASD